MPPVLAPVSYEPIKAVRILSQQGAVPTIFRVPEAATQTFQIGVPTIQSSGFLVEWTTTTALSIYGISSERAKNYAVNGGNVTLTLPPVIPTSTDLNEPASGPPPNQPNAAVIPMGAAIRDGQCGVYIADAIQTFSIALRQGQTFTTALLVPGTAYGLTKDVPSGFWFLDTTVTTGNSAVATLIGVDPSSPNDGVNGTRVFFMIIASRRVFS